MVDRITIEELPGTVLETLEHEMWVMSGGLSVKITIEQALRLAEAGFIAFDPTGTGLSETDIQTALAELDGLAMKKAANGSDIASIATFRSNIGVASAIVSQGGGLTLDATHRAKTIRCTAAITLALTAAATLGADWFVDVIAEGGNVVIDPNAAELVDGVASIIVYKGQSARIIGTGAAFYSMRDRAFAPQMIHVCDEKSNTTGGGASSAGVQHERTLNTTILNTIDGASLGSNRVTLPAGTYDYEGSAPCRGGDRHKVRLRNVTAGSTIDTGENEFANASSGVQTRSRIAGRFTITSTSVFALEHYIATALVSVGLGTEVSSGNVERYADLKFWKVGL